MIDHLYECGFIMNCHHVVTQVIVIIIVPHVKFGGTLQSPNNRAHEILARNRCVFISGCEFNHLLS